MANKFDIDPIETAEWLEALSSVKEVEGADRAKFLVEELAKKLEIAFASNALVTPYVNTIPKEQEAKMPGNLALEGRIRALVRWNAMAMVVRANRKSSDLGGHIASFASSATLYETGFNHFFKGQDHPDGGDLVYIQGHTSPGIYARAFLEGRIGEAELNAFRQEITSEKGLSSYPHPWLMPSFWQFPTVSMGLGPIQSIYQARFMKYLQNRELTKTEARKVWCFCGDGEMDEPESLGAISLAGREKLNNLIFVINCNLQRLDGPVRGNGKIIQELEGVFRGAGWKVIKVLWGSNWDPLLENDTQGLLKARMEEAVDGEFQNYKSHSGAYTREHFFGANPELAKMVEGMSDEEIWHLQRGGHDPQKVYAAYHEAVNTKDMPVVILAKTVKGYGMGEAAEGKNITHQLKKLDVATIKHIRDRFQLDISDETLDTAPFIRPPEDSEEITYIKARRKELGGYLPCRQVSDERLVMPKREAFASFFKSSEGREISSTMAFVRILNQLMKDKAISDRIVPIIPDEARTFGMEAMFRPYGIYSSVGQKYKPVDAGQVMYYREDQKGQILEEGITEAGSFSSWMAAATSYANHDLQMIPFYIFYSMFGFQRIGDLAWAAGDLQARGFLIGATAGRTTLAGEGLQHQDGQSLLHAAMIPNCVAYDPTYAYEMAVIIQDGLRRMYEEQESVFYYITAMNENYEHPEMPKGVEDGILKGMYALFKVKKPKLELLGSGTILNEVVAAAKILKKEYDIDANVWSVTSFNELRKEALVVERQNRLKPGDQPSVSYVEEVAAQFVGPVIAATDYMRSYPEQIRPWISNRYVTLGTDGFGRSDTRQALRSFFEVNAEHIVIAALESLVKEGVLKRDIWLKALKKLETNHDLAPWQR